MNASANPPPDLFPPLEALESALWPGIALAVFIVSAAIVDAVVILAARWRLVDLPNLRSAHALPTARGGGIAIVVTMTLGTIAVAMRWPSMIILLLGALVPSIVIAVVGAIDDVRPLRAITRLLIQLAAAVTMTALVGPIRSIAVPWGGAVDFGPFAWLLTVLWIVGMTNAFNFMDGIDGMCGGQAWVAGAAVAVIGLVLWVPPVMVLGAFLAGAVAGFLVFNWHPARVFMGDVGSGFLGMFLAAMPMLFPRHLRPIALVPFVLAVWPTIFDAGASVVRRTMSGHNPLVPHREFFFHRLVRSGVGHGRVSLLYAVLSGIGAAIGVLALIPGVPVWVNLLVPLWLVGMPVGLAWGVESRCAKMELAPPGSVSREPSRT